MSIIDDLRERRKSIPFQPFAVRMSDGQEHPVATVEHLYLVPGGRAIMVADHRGVTVMLPVSYITELVQFSPAA